MKTRRVRSGLYLVAAAVLSGACGSNGAASPADASPAGTKDAGPFEAPPSDASASDASASDTAPAVDGASYADPSMWLCGAPGTPHDYCLDPQSATVIHPDLTQTTVALTPSANPAIDCFYVYPSVDITSPAGNETDFSNLTDILEPVHAQAAPFSQVCKVYAPFYHQATYNSYSSSDPNKYLEVAYADIASAFHEYMTGYNHGRDFVLIGHSQGSHMLRRLIQREVETSPTVLGHLLLAILAGALGDTTVPTGQVVGGSFKSTPLCTGDSQRGCVLSWSTFAKGYEPTSAYPPFPLPAGMDVPCTNPASLSGGKGILSDTLFFTQATSTLAPPQSSGVMTAFAAYPAFFSGECLAASDGKSFFEVDPEPAAGDQRTNPIPFDNTPYFNPATLGLHLLDMQFPMQDLLDAVTKRAPAADGGAADAASSD